MSLDFRFQIVRWRRAQAHKCHSEFVETRGQLFRSQFSAHHGGGRVSGYCCWAAYGSLPLSSCLHPISRQESGVYRFTPLHPDFMWVLGSDVVHYICSAIALLTEWSRLSNVFLINDLAPFSWGHIERSTSRCWSLLCTLRAETLVTGPPASGNRLSLPPVLLWTYMLGLQACATESVLVWYAGWFNVKLTQARVVCEEGHSSNFHL